MPENSNKKATKKPTKQRTAIPLEARANLGVLHDFTGPVPPPRGRGRYPWSTVQPGKYFDLPAGSRSCVSQQAKKWGRVLEVRDDSDLPGCVRVYCSGLAAPTTTATE